MSEWVGVWGARVGVYLPVLAALVVAAAGAAVLRRRPAWAVASAAAAALIGWALLVPAPWRGLFWPRSPVEHLLFPALVVVVSSMLRVRLQTRWLTAVTLVAIAWWLAEGAARAEVWRAGFAVGAIGCVLSRAGAAEPRRALAVGLGLWGGLVIAGAAAWSQGVALVLAACAAGAWLGRATLPSALATIAVAGVGIGAGRALRGGFGMADATWLCALVAPLALPWVDPALVRRMGRAGRVLAPCLVALGVVAAAWILDRVVRAP